MTGEVPGSAEPSPLGPDLLRHGTRHDKSARLSFSDLIRLGLIGIKTRKLRATLSALGISIGIATMVVVTGIPASSQAALLEELTALGTDMLRVDPLPRPDDPVLLPERAPEMLDRIPPVTATAAVANVHSTVRRSDRLPANSSSGITVLASTPDLLASVNGEVASGAFLQDAPAEQPVVVLGYVAAGRLGISTVPSSGPKPQVLIGDTHFTVIGVLDQMPLAADLERSVMVSWGAAKNLLGFDGHPTVVYVKADEAALDDVRQVLPATLHPQAAGLVQVSRPSDALSAKQATQENFTGLFIGLAAVSLLVGGIGVANTMFISVLERRREIGLRRALGATRGQIRAQFLTEAVALSGLGGIAGTIIGTLGTLAYTASQGWPTVIQPLTLALGIGGALVVGMIAGIDPARRAAKLTPTEALATP